ncbi:MAG TPA: hypothetical protein VII35_12105, partial [Steroidobacteraceae bacterium]
MAGNALMGTPARTLRLGLCAAWCLSILSCGGGDSTPVGTAPAPTGANVASAVVDAGPAGTSDV